MAPRRFQWLLRLLPPSFREEHERELLRVWREESHADRMERRPGTWRRALVDTLRVAPFEYAAALVRNQRFAVRSLWRSRSFALTAVLTLACGIGATTSVFALINAVLLRPLPWREPDRVGLVWAVQPSGDTTWLSFPEIEELQRQVPALGSAAGFTDLRPTLVVDGVGHEIQALAVSHQFFGMLGVMPVRGRNFNAGDDRQGAAPSAVISDEFWRTRLGRRPSAIGSKLRLNDRDVEIIGVLPPSFTLLPASSVLPNQVDVWLPLEPNMPSRDRSVRFLHAMARLEGATSYGEASRQLQAHGARVSAEYPATYRNGSWRFSIAPFQAEVLGPTRTSLLVIFGLVGLVFLMTCANVASLFLARGELRQAELVTRMALGAGPARLAGELTAEGLTLAVAGGAVGLAFAAVTPALLRRIDGAALPRLEQAGADARVLAFAVVMAAVSTAIVAGAPLVERWRLRRTALSAPHRNGGRTRRSAAIGGGLVVVQTALATAVLITALFLTNVLSALHRTDLGFASEHLLTARVSLSPKYERDAVPRFFEQAIDALQSSADIIGAAAISQAPMSGAMLGSSFMTAPHVDAARIDAELRSISAGYFEVARQPLLQGRSFARHDGSLTRPVAIVDELFARRLAPDGQVVGRRIRWFRQPDIDIEIVGVVKAIRHRGPMEPARPTVYRPMSQYSRASMFLVARTRGDAGERASDLIAAVRAADPSQPIADVATVDQRLARSVRGPRTSRLLAGVLASLALGLGLVGLYGVISVGIAQRQQEFGIRMCLGATSSRIAALVLREGAVLTMAGAAIGAAIASAIVKFVATALYGADVGVAQPYAIGVAVVCLAAAVALSIPARRAAAVSPLVAVRSR